MLCRPSFKRIDFLSLLCVFTFVFCLVPLCFTATEQITLTTFYPAPYGNYQTLNTQTLYANFTYTDALAVGREYRDVPLTNGLLIVSEKVGIGTAAPRVDVHLDQNTFAAMRISSPTTYNSALQLYDNNAPPSYGVGVTPNSGWAILKESGTGNLRINRDNQENNGTRPDLTITRTTGNIGIGTTAPQSPAPNGLAGNLDVNDIYLRSQNRWISQPQVQIKENISSGGDAMVFCDPGWTLIGCSGAREQDVQDTCGEEDCGYIGVIPVDQNGVRATVNARGCKVGIDSDSGTEPTVHAYCMKSSP